VSRAPAISLLVAALAPGCGLGLYQTARTTPRGKVDVAVAGAFQYNDLVPRRGVTPFNFPTQVNVRVGVHDRVDLGATVLMAGGLLVDAKVNVAPPGRALALSVLAGVGAAADWGEEGASTLHLPVTLIASWTFLDVLTPYVGLGYGFWWFFGRPVSEPDPSATYAQRAGHGDGVLRLTAGLEWLVGGGFGILVEYSYLPVVVDDPGDNFAFRDNHLVGFGLRF
jgi:hypothetical protein